MSTTAMALAPSSGTQLAWCQPQTADQAWTLAETIAKSRLAPKGYESVEQIFIAMQHGAELGLNAMQSLQGIAMVNGRPAVWGTTLWALVQRSRIVKRWMKGTLAMPAVEKIITGIWKGKTDANAALVDALVVRLADRVDEMKLSQGKVATPATHLVGYAVFQIDEDFHVQLFDSAHAQKARLLGKQGPWTEYPERMHQHRAVTFLARDTCGTALTGIAGSMTAEELMDHPDAVDAVASEVRQPERASVTVRMQDMAATPAGAPAAGPGASAEQDAKAAASARLRDSIARLKTIPWHGDEPLSADEHRTLISRTMTPMFGTRTAGQLSADERNVLADALDRIQPPAPAPAYVDATAEPEPDHGGQDGEPEDKTNF